MVQNPACHCLDLVLIPTFSGCAIAGSPNSGQYALCVFWRHAAHPTLRRSRMHGTERRRLEAPKPPYRIHPLQRAQGAATTLAWIPVRRLRVIVIVVVYELRTPRTLGLSCWFGKAEAASRSPINQGGNSPPGFEPEALAAPLLQGGRGGDRTRDLLR